MIGIIGGYGNIGKEIVKLLISRGHYDITIGSRQQHLDPTDNALADIPWCSVNIENRKSIYDFMEKHSIIINSAGPSSALSLKVAECARDVGCHLIDCGYNSELPHLSLKDTNQSILYNIGTVPGLSELLPLAVAEDFEHVHEFLHFYSIIGKFTRTAATDFIGGLFTNNGSNKSTMSGNTVKLEDISPFFKNIERMIRYGNSETDQVQKRINCSNAEWYNVICGKNMDAFLKYSLRKFFSEKEKLITELCLATEMDSLVTSENISFLIKMKGINKKREVLQKQYYLQAPSQKIVSASFCVAVSECLLENNIYTGIGGIEKIKNPVTVLEKIQQYDGIEFKTMDWTEINETEEGML